jgi:hypothetical protein
MQKDQFMAAYKAICDIGELLDKADDLYQSIPPEIQEAMRNYHSENGSLAYCLRWGQTAAGDIREDWHTVVSGLEVSG